jgi:hypothetical protein
MLARWAFVSDDFIEDEAKGSIEDEATAEEAEEVQRRWEGAVGDVFDRFDLALTFPLTYPPPGRAWQGPEPLTLRELGLLDLFDAGHSWSVSSEFQWWLDNTPLRGYLVGFDWAGGGPGSNWSQSLGFLSPPPGRHRRGYIYLGPDYEVEREWSLLASVEPYDDPDLVGTVLARVLATPAVAGVLYGTLPDNIYVGNVVDLSREALIAIVNTMAELCEETVLDLDFIEEAGEVERVRITQ